MAGRRRRNRPLLPAAPSPTAATTHPRMPLSTFPVVATAPDHKPKRARPADRHRRTRTPARRPLTTTGPPPAHPHDECSLRVPTSPTGVSPNTDPHRGHPALTYRGTVLMTPYTERPGNSGAFVLVGSDPAGPRGRGGRGSSGSAGRRRSSGTSLSTRAVMAANHAIPAKGAKRRLSAGPKFACNGNSLPTSPLTPAS
jgi:hypothetical protein